jgi:hypothetical protein
MFPRERHERHHRLRPEISACHREGIPQGHFGYIGEHQYLILFCDPHDIPGQFFRRLYYLEFKQLTVPPRICS